MSGRDLVLLFDNVTLMIVTIIGTLMLMLVRCGCVCRTRRPRIDVTQVESPPGMLGKEKNAQIPVELAQNQTINVQNKQPVLIPAPEPNQNNAASPVIQKKVETRNKEETNIAEKKDDNKGNQEKSHLNKKLQEDEKQLLIKETAKAGDKQHDNPTQPDELKEPKTKQKKRGQRRKRSTATEGDTREGDIREGGTKTRDEESSTLEGVASIAIDNAPSYLSQVHAISTKMNVVSKRRNVAKNLTVKNNK